MPVERYNNSSAKWVFYDAKRNDVREANIGWGDSTLYLPSVSSCIAVVMALNDATLLGAHFDKLLSVTDVEVMLDKMLEKKANRTVNYLSVIGNMTYRDQEGKGFMVAPKFQGKQLLLTFAGKFGVKGTVASYDQGQRADKHYLVEVAGGGTMRLHYADVAKNESGNPVPFDRNKITWLEQPLTVLMET
jgi:hypothetical protein